MAAAAGDCLDWKGEQRSVHHVVYRRLLILRFLGTRTRPVTKRTIWINVRPQTTSEATRLAVSSLWRDGYVERAGWESVHFGPALWRITEKGIQALRSAGMAS